jgi:hypothetical protein
VIAEALIAEIGIRSDITRLELFLNVLLSAGKSSDQDQYYCLTGFFSNDNATAQVRSLWGIPQGSMNWEAFYHLPFFFSYLSLCIYVWMLDDGCLNV